MSSSRRRFLQTSALATVGFAASADRLSSSAQVATDLADFPSAAPPHKPAFPVADYHVHLSPTLSIDQALMLSRERKVAIGILEHPGPGYPINTDADLKQYIDRLRPYPVRIGLQPVYAGWSKAFSPALLEQLDYILMDALTLPRSAGEWLAIWQIDTMVDDGEQFMTRYMEFIEQVLTTEPIDIFGWPTFLPVPIARQYRELWTPRRIERIISLCANPPQSGMRKKIAIEINELAHVPDENFVTQARRAGLKFTFGTDSRNQNAAHFSYCYQMADRCGLTEKDMFVVNRK